MKKRITTITGPTKSYKTAMLILVANHEALRSSRRVKYVTGDETETVLRRRGLSPLVEVRQLTDPRDENWAGRVVSASTADPEDCAVWRARQAKRH